MQILELGGQEGPEGSFHSHGLSLGEAQEVCTPDAAHGAGLGAVQGDQVELQRWAVKLMTTVRSHRVAVAFLTPGPEV